MGYGVLLWSVPEKSLASGALLPVYIKSNIDGAWVVGVPGTDEKLEIPLWQLHYSGSRRSAQSWAEGFAPYAGTYAETLQDGLPVRGTPDNTSDRVYRLRQGQIVKILAKVEGSQAVSGDQSLPGDWYQILTDDGTEGYCFSYRLRLYEPVDGDPSLSLAAASPSDSEAAADGVLESILSRTWRPESYKSMIDDRRIDLSRFSSKYGFFPGQESGKARIVTEDLDLSFPYSSVTKVKDSVYRFEGSTLQVTLRRRDVLGIQYTDDSGAQKGLVFVSLPAEATDYVDQETERRSMLFKAILDTGPEFRSENYGSLRFSPAPASGASAPSAPTNPATPTTGRFSWSGYELLSPTVVPRGSGRTGAVQFKLFLDDALSSSGWTGALSLSFDGAPAGRTVDFLYTLDPGGLRLEYLPQSSLDGTLVVRRSVSPTIVYFSRLER